MSASAHTHQLVRDGHALDDTNPVTSTTTTSIHLLITTTTRHDALPCPESDVLNFIVPV